MSLHNYNVKDFTRSFIPVLLPVSGRGLKSLPPKVALPPRFQRQQQQQHQGYDDSYVEPSHHTSIFRRRGSGRRSGEGYDVNDRVWHRDGDAENGTEPDREEDLQVCFDISLLSMVYG